MINLSVGNINQFAIYADTISNDVQTFGDYFLFGFKNLYTRTWTYVVPEIVKRNSRFIQFNLIIVEGNSPDDPLNSIVSLYPPGNWSYKCWNIDYPTLDPSVGTLIDEGQMIMASYSPPEIAQYTYQSDNEYLQSIIYYSGTVGGDCYIYVENSPYVVDEDITNLCQPLTISENGGLLVIKDGFTFALN